ncbi:MAG: nickel-dependent hydrogenase large subunit [Desulfobacterales bacterium]|nr:nickel-dependent hydrogenase large subunit [Desulfobacterales bacterium]MCF8080543.1 nickel-dependent hydrogenase large subunit [Desulfobacterales bacterium]
MTVSVIPVGPQHPVFLEPFQLKLVVEDEVVSEALPRFGYVHRGLEALVVSKDFRQMTRVAERICGICSAIHGMTYCRAIEKLLGITPPPRAQMLRLVWSELHRMHSHLLWLGLFAEAMGFESLFMQIFRIRETVMDILEQTTGNRVIISVNVIGGVRRDLDAEGADGIRRALKKVAGDLERIRPVLVDDYSVRKRTEEKGILAKERAYELGAVGPVLRASGISQDIRRTGYGAYGELDFEPVVESGGDCQARCKVRYRELFQSMDLIRSGLDRLSDGEIQTKSKEKPEGEILVRSEQPRGEVVYYIRADGSKHLQRLRIRTPTFANMAALMDLLPGLDLADVPLVTLSLDPCIACTER